MRFVKEMNSRGHGAFVVFTAVLFLSSARGLPVGGLPVGGEARHDFSGREFSSELSASLAKKRSEAILESDSSHKRSGTDDVSSVSELDEEEQDIDYDLLERLTSEHLIRSGGDLDRELTDGDYVQITEYYLKHKEEGRKNSSTSEILHGPETNESRTTAKKPDGEHHSDTEALTARDVYTTRTSKNENLDGKNTSVNPDIWRNSTTTSDQKLSGNGSTKQHGRWWENTTKYSDKLWTSKPNPNENPGGKTTKDRWWVTSPSNERNSPSPDDGHKSMSWTGKSKGGHQVHVVVYFDK